MRGAAPVRMGLGEDAPWRAICVAVPALSVGVLAGWLMAWIGVGAVVSLSGAVGAGAAIVAWQMARTRSRPAGPALLCWDGQTWSVDGEPVGVQVMIDLEDWLLLKVRSNSGARTNWCPLRVPASGVERHRLRAVLHHAVEVRHRPARPATEPHG